MSAAETDPLLQSDSDSTIVHDESADHEQQPLTPDKSSREVENDVIPETAVVGRRIGWASAYIIVISRVIGSGIFAMPGTVIQTVGSPGLALVLWVIGSLVAWAGLAIDMEYGCMLPKSGGTKVYLEYTYRWPKFFASTMVAVQAVLLGFTATNCLVFAKYTMYAFQIQPNDVATKSLAIGLLTWITIVHGCFYRTGVWIQNVLGWLKVALIAFMIVTGLFVVIIRRPTDTLEVTSAPVWWKDVWKDSDFAWNNISTSFFKIVYSYAGLSNVNNVLNEVKNPVRTLKTVGPTALITACILYLLANLSYLAVVPLQDIKESRELIAALFFERVFGARFGGVFLPLVIAISAAGNVMVVTFSLVCLHSTSCTVLTSALQARLNQEVARQGFLPFPNLIASSKPFGAPLGGLIVHYIPSLLVIACPPSATAYSFIADVEGYAGQFFFIAIAAGLILLRYRRPELTRPFKAWLPAVWLRIILAASLVVAPFFPSKKGHSDVDFFYASYALVAVSV